VKIIIDGYNLIKQSPRFHPKERLSLETAREALLEELAYYQRVKGHRIWVIFDGLGGGHLGNSLESYKGINVVYTGRESADDWIKRHVGRGETVVVVSSDREIRDHTEKMGSVAIPSPNFEERLQRALLKEWKGEEEEEDEYLPPPRRHRLPKKERFRRRILNKL